MTAYQSKFKFHVFIIYFGFDHKKHWNYWGQEAAIASNKSRLDPVEQDNIRFLQIKNYPNPGVKLKLKILRMKTVLFRAKPGSFLLSGTIKKITTVNINPHL